MTAAASEVWAELKADVASIAAEVMGDAGPDGVSLSENEYLEYLRRGWAQPDPAGSQFRMQEFQRIVAVGQDGQPSEIGLANWERTIKKAFPDGFVPPPPPPPESPLNQMARQGMAEAPLPGGT
jgi:hypothetical protein